MGSFLSCIVIFQSLSLLAYPQLRAEGSTDSDSTPPFEIYGLASAMRTVDACTTLVITNPSPNQPLGFTPSGGASGARTGLVWRKDAIGLVADIGFHMYADRLGSTSMAPLMAGLRVYSDEHFRTAFYGEFLTGAYRWTMRRDSVNFTRVKGIVSAGGGMDIRLTHSAVFRVFDLEIMIAGAQNGPLLTGRASSGIAYRLGER
jgi:hypothetical protein